MDFLRFAAHLLPCKLRCAAMLENPRFPPRPSECEDRFLAVFYVPE